MFARSSCASDGSTGDNPWQIAEAVGAVLAALFTGAIVVFAYIQVRDARLSSERQLRAYVFPRAKALTNYAVGETPSLEITIKNYGQTPAYKLAQVSTWGYQDFPLTERLPPLENSDEERRPLAPSDHILAWPTFQNPITSAQIAEIHNGKKALYFLGRIDYVDAFGARRWVTYCYYSGGNLPVGNVASYKGGNKTSDDVTF